MATVAVMFQGLLAACFWYLKWYSRHQLMAQTLRFHTQRTIHLDDGDVGRTHKVYK